MEDASGRVSPLPKVGVLETRGHAPEIDALDRQIDNSRTSLETAAPQP